MLKIRNKRFALLLVFAMLVSMFAGVGIASASSTYSTISVPTVLADGLTHNLGTLQIDIPQVTSGTHTVLLTLPSDFDYTNGTPTVSFVKDGNGNDGFKGDTNASKPAPVSLDGGTGIVKIDGDSREFKVSITADDSTVYDLRMLVSLPNVIVPDSASGEIDATLTGLVGNAFSSGTIAVANATGSGAVTVYTTSTPDFTSNGTTDPVEINIKESTPNAFAKGDTVKIKLPKGYTWDDNASVLNVNTGDTDVQATAAPDTDTRTLIVTRNVKDTTNSKFIFRVSDTISVDDSTAKLGDVTATFSGTADSSPSSLVIGTYVDYSATAVVTGTVGQILAGQTDQSVADFKIKENVAGSLLANRSITMKLPDGVKWFTLPTPSVSGSTELTNSGLTMVGTDGRSVKFAIDKASSSAGEIKFSNVSVMTASDFSGDVVVDITGAGLDEQKITIANVKPALTGTATTKDIKIGVQGQDAGTMDISESMAGTLLDGQDLTVTLPDNVTWSADPTVTVTAGDLDIDDISTDGSVLTIPIKSQSATASTIEISNIKLDVDRTVPEGAIKATIDGAAVDQVNYLTAANDAGDFYTPSQVGDYYEVFQHNTAALKLLVANCVTPAPDKTVYNTASFVIGASTFTLNGNATPVVAASYIKNDRTYLAIRDIGTALGIDQNNILWDGAKNTVTLMKGDKVAQLTIGSTTLLVNGAAITMDVAPEIGPGDRTMLPAAFVAQAFGAAASWDATTQTVTIK